MSDPRSNGRAGVGIVGAGEFGQTFMAQAARSPHFALRVVFDRSPEKALTALANAGHGADAHVRCASREAALRAIEAGKIAVIEDHALMVGLPIVAVVEATGVPGTAAAVAESAIAAGYHVAMATKEAEVVVGPALARRAKAAGVVHTVVDGDQPSLLIGLIARARLLGLTVVAAGKSTEADYILDAERGTVTAWGRTVAVEGYAWRLDDLASLEGRRIVSLATKTVPDLCEMTIVANHTDIVPDRPELHGPVARTVELPSLFRPQAAGGLLEQSGVVDVFTCLRRPDEISFAGGVFVVVEAPDPTTGRVLASKGIPASGDGRYLLLHNPVHLLGVEALASLYSAVHLGRSTGGKDPRQRFDLVARTTRAFAAGELLTIGERHEIPDLAPLILPARGDEPTAPIPYYLAATGRIARPVAAGQLLTLAQVEIDPASALCRLRREALA